MTARFSDELDRRYYLDLACAFVRGRRPGAAHLAPEALLRFGLDAGLRLHKFKRNTGLPRVRRVLGLLRGLGPESILDVGCGRGTFLWPLLDALPWVPVFAVDRKMIRVRDVAAVRSGGIHRLHGFRADGQHLPLAAKSVDVVTHLEVLEHVPEPEHAAREAVRVARRFVVVSVPSKPDENPEHLSLFRRSDLEAMFLNAGARSVRVDGVPNHHIAVVSV